MPRSRRITITCFGAFHPVVSIVAPGSYGSDLGREDTPGGRRDRQTADSRLWCQLEGRASDALATGQALCALAAAGEEPESPAIRRARRFLLNSQREDGSWLVRTRTPRGHDEIVNYYGTGWATIGLIRSMPGRRGGR
jgi:hypothetical protein